MDIVITVIEQMWPIYPELTLFHVICRVLFQTLINISTHERRRRDMCCDSVYCVFVVHSNKFTHFSAYLQHGLHQTGINKNKILTM